MRWSQVGGDVGCITLQGQVVPEKKDSLAFAAYLDEK